MAENDFFVYWQNAIEWFLGLPLFGQVLIIAGIVAILVLTVICIYYILKGVVYLIYYILKGIYYLLKYLFLGIYKLFEALYYLISGKEKPKKGEEKPKIEECIEIKEKIPEIIVQQEPQISFCSECGCKFSESMVNQLNTTRQVFCIHCGILIDAIDIHS